MLNAARYLLCGLVWAFPLMTVMAGDWPGLRGPMQDGVARDEKLSEPSLAPGILWSRNLGQGYSSVAIAGLRAYTQYQTALGQYVICFERDTGRTIWETRVGDPYELIGIYPGPRSTPAVHKGAVYFTTPDGEVGALDAASGRTLWMKALQSELRGVGTEFGYSASPIIADDRLYLPIGGPGASVVALDLPSGEIAWKSGEGGASYCSSLTITLDGRPLLVTYLQNHLVIQDRQTGKEYWRTDLSSGYDEHSAMPIYREPLLVVSAPFQAGSTAYRLSWSADSPPQLQVVQAWHQPKFSHDVDSATLVGETLFGFDLRDPQSKAHRPSRGEFRAVDLRSGEILWSSKTLGQSNILAVGEDLLLLNDGGELIRIAANREQVIERWRLRVFEDEIIWTPPALSSGVLIMRSHSRMIAVRVSAPVVGQETTATVTRSWWPSLHGISSLLLQGEREHPFMRPDRSELFRWYLQCLAVLVLPVGWYLCSRHTMPESSNARWHQALWAIAVMGMAATPILNHWSPDQFSFTWPISILSLFQSAVLSAIEVGKAPSDPAIRRRSRCVGLALVGLCLAQFLLLRQASLPHEWVFLLSPVPAVPAAVWGARIAAKRGRQIVVVGLFWVSVTCGLWGAAYAPNLLAVFGG